ncbi:lipase maturation factor family protein [Estrella lausannensis]|uniref:Conserved putative membrane protein n=1 Tax=Estrella lausannensis TaxID=483423 RepID=A0A0H5DQ34_9BACT|nr:lipase maturation factor family protein [Estrella lausannensis]CRX38592.1 Conserved putative membrane protein [Estrella lausannensis]
MWTPEHYLLSSSLFLKLLGAIFFIALGSLFVQIKGLIGSRGILPLKEFINLIGRSRGISKRRLPMLFWINAEDRFIQGTILLGLIASILLIQGIWSPLQLALLFVIYLSVFYAGQEFLSFGWELFLIEITAHAFLLSCSYPANPMVFFSLNFLLFRFHIQAGAVKLESCDLNWRNLSALKFHYQSQPLPNTQAWFFHKLPLPLQKLSCLYMFFVELVVPFGIFFEDTVRLIVFSQFFLLQFFIWLTGNFSYLNYMTIALSVVLLPDWVLPDFLGNAAPAAPTPLWLNLFLYAGGSALFFLQVLRLYDHFAPTHFCKKILSFTAPYCIANRYGIFAVMTTKRIEIVIEGSDDGLHWKEYCFKYKPSEISRRPRRISPFQPRLDWQVWFLPFRSFRQEVWFQRFLFALLEGREEVLGLLRLNPFPEKPPRLIRALAYEYVFTDFKELSKTGNWWKRTYVGSYSPTLAIKEVDRP